MKYCSVEHSSFPDREFRFEPQLGGWYHYPPGESGHPRNSGHPADGPPPGPTALPDADDDPGGGPF